MKSAIITPDIRLNNGTSTLSHKTLAAYLRRFADAGQKKSDIITSDINNGTSTLSHKTLAAYLRRFADAGQKKSDIITSDIRHQQYQGKKSAIIPYLCQPNNRMMYDGID